MNAIVGVGTSPSTVPPSGQAGPPAPLAAPNLPARTKRARRPGFGLLGDLGSSSPFASKPIDRSPGPDPSPPQASRSPATHRPCGDPTRTRTPPTPRIAADVTAPPSLRRGRVRPSGAASDQAPWEALPATSRTRLTDPEQMRRRVRQRRHLVWVLPCEGECLPSITHTFSGEMTGKRPTQRRLDRRPVSRASRRRCRRGAERSAPGRHR